MRARVALCLLVGACTAGPAPADLPQEVPVVVKTGCDVTVSFGSYGMGVDRGLKYGILSFVSSDEEATAGPERRWGREGESTVCIMTDSAAARERIYDGIVARIPDYSPIAPTTVTHIDGRTHASRMPPESGQ